MLLRIFEKVFVTIQRRLGQAPAVTQQIGLEQIASNIGLYSIELTYVRFNNFSISLNSYKFLGFKNKIVNASHLQHCLKPVLTGFKSYYQKLEDLKEAS